MPSGRFMQIDGVPRAINFSVNDTKNSQATSSSVSRGGTDRGGGVRDWNGQFGAQGGKPSHMPGRIFDFEGYLTPDNGVEGGDGDTVQGPVLVNQTTVNWGWASNERLNWVSSFLGKPGVSYVTTTPTLDNAAPVDEFACGTFIEYSEDNGGTWHTIPKLVSATLVFTIGVTAESNSSTVANGECFIDRTPGNVDWTLSMNQQDRKRGIAGAPDLGDNIILRAYINPTQFFYLKWGKPQAYSGLQVDRQTNTPIARTINIAMKSNNPDEDPSIGQIILPGETVPYWPAPLA